VTADPVEWPEAIAWFSDRFPITEDLATELADYAGPRAWTIAGVTQLDVVQYVHDSLERAIAKGTAFDVWQAEVEEKLTAAWGKRDSPRMLTVFINANQQSYNSGRWSQMNDPDVRALRPFGMYDSVVDDHTTAFCRSWDGVILPLQQFAERNACPQTHHRCRAGIRSLRPGDVDRRGGVTKKIPDGEAAEGFGAAPTTARFVPDPAKYDRELWNEYQRKAAELEESKRPRIKKTG
jgi:hypothetical protein